MKKGICLACLTALTVIASGCYTAPPALAVSTPPPTPVPPPTGYVVYEPEYYVWDGAEYVGVSGGQYVYWTGGAWLAAPPVIIGRFHGWQRYHPEWRRHAIPYHHRERFR